MKKRNRAPAGKNILPFSLVFGPGDLPGLKKKAGTPWGTKILSHLRSACEPWLTADIVLTKREWVTRLFEASQLAFVGLVDCSQKHLDAAKKRLLAITAVDPWIYDQMLDTGEAVSNACLALDWGWEAYSKKEAVRVIDTIIANAVENGDPAAKINAFPNSRQNDGYFQSLVDFLSYTVADKYEYGRSGARPWHKELQATNNWDVVVGAGLMLGWAVAFIAHAKLKLPLGKAKRFGFKLDNARLEKWYDIAKQRFMNFSSRCYSARGGYNEGPGYYLFGTLYGLIGLETARRLHGEDLYSFGLKQSPLWQRELYPWDIAAGSQNFNDSQVPGHPRLDVIARLAAENRSPWMQQFFFELLGQNSHITPLALVWANRTLAAGGLPPLARYINFGETGDVMWRTGRNASKDIHCMFRCGKWNAAHTHFDRNSLVLSAFGERLLVDAGTSYPYSNDVCSKYQRQSIGHNTVLMDGKGQAGSNELPTYGRIMRSESDANGNALVVGDAKHCYAKASTALRAVRFDTEGFVVVYDVCEGRAAEYSVLWHTDNRDAKARVEQSGNALVITRPAATLLIISFFPLTSTPIEQGYIDSHPKGSALYVEVKQRTGRFLNLLVPLKPGETVSHELKGTGDGATLEFTLRGKKHALSLNPNGPGFKLDNLLVDLSAEYEGN